MQEFDRSRDINWGGKFHCVPETDLATAHTVFKVDRIGTESPQVLTIALGRQDFSQGVNVDWRAQIQWGIGAQRQQLECDWIEGGLVRVPGIAVEVCAVAYAPRRVSIDTTGTDIWLSASVGIGSGGSIPPCYSQTLPPLVAGGSSGDIRPPSFARALSVYPDNGASTNPYADMVLELYRPDGVTRIVRIPGDVLAGGAAVPLLGAALARVVNTSGINPMSPTLVWLLGAG